jgi:hypothetical protein
MRRSMLLAPILLLLAGTAHAQGERPHDPYDPPIVPQGSDMRPMGNVLGVYDKEAIGEPDKPEDRCGKQVGCIVFMNVTHTFDVVGIYIDTRGFDDPRGPRWDTNLLKGTSLGPRRSMFTFRNGDRTMCNQRVRVVMRHRKSRTELEGVPGNVNLCNDRSNQNIVFPVRVVEGRVIIEPGEAGE